jgi:threonine/homoserine/homoserine lactone efflux protein
MDWTIWLSFAAATTALVLTPGPTVLLVVSYGMARGWRAAVPMALGVALGDLTAIVVCLIGVGALLQASATAFAIVKWIGAAYLIWMGWRLWRRGAGTAVRPAADGRPLARLAFDVWLVTTFNPKGILFFIAFMPQFFDPAAAFLPQAAILTATFCGIAFLSALNYGLLAGRSARLVTGDRAMGALRRGGGAALMAAGLATAVIRRPA